MAKRGKRLPKHVMIGENDKVFQIIDNFKRELPGFITGFYKINIEAKNIAGKSYISASNSIKKTVFSSILVSIILIGIVVLIAVYLSKHIFNSLSFFNNIFTKGTSGDLEARYPVKKRG